MFEVRGNWVKIKTLHTNSSMTTFDALIALVSYFYYNNIAIIMLTSFNNKDKHRFVKGLLPNSLIQIHFIKVISSQCMNGNEAMITFFNFDLYWYIFHSGHRDNAICNFFVFCTL